MKKTCDVNLDDIDIERSWNNFKRIVGDREFCIRSYDDHRVEVFELPDADGILYFSSVVIHHIVYQYKKFLKIWIDLSLIEEIQKGKQTYPCFKITD